METMLKEYVGDGKDGKVRSALTVVVAVCIMASAGKLSADDLTVYQDLEEVTQRIGNLADKPYKALIDANGGCFQDETIIFKDLETGNEMWSLSREKCRDMGDVRRRPAWSCEGRYISFRGNQAFLDYEAGTIVRPGDDGNTYIANADGSGKRPLWAKVDGQLSRFSCSMLNMWDSKRPGTWYCARGRWLWRVTVAPGVTGSKAERLHEFEDAESRTLHYVSDTDFLLISQMLPTPRCYVVNLDADPGDPRFCMSHPLEGNVNMGGFRIMRSRDALSGRDWRGCRLSFEDGKDLMPLERARDHETHISDAVIMAHMWYGLPDDRVGFFGEYKGEFGLYLQMPGDIPVLMAKVGDGHVTWCGKDPDWFFAAVGPGTPGMEYGDGPYLRKLLACKADGRTTKVVCTPFDRRRGDEGGYSALPLPIQSPDGTKCWFHSSMLYDSNQYTGSFIAVFRRPYAPVSLRLADGRGGVCLEWDPHALSNETKGYNVYRGDDGWRTLTLLTDEPVEGTAFTDKNARVGRTYVYAVTSQEWSGLESDASSPTVKVSVEFGGPPREVAAGEPVRGWDKSAPSVVRGFSAARNAEGLVVLRWEAVPDGDLRLYNIYASSAGRPDVCQKRLLVSPVRGGTSYIDWTARKGGDTHYAITAVDRQGNESKAAYADLADSQAAIKSLAEDTAGAWASGNETAGPAESPEDHSEGNLRATGQSTIEKALQVP